MVESSSFNRSRSAFDLRISKCFTNTNELILTTPSEVGNLILKEMINSV